MEESVSATMSQQRRSFCHVVYTLDVVRVSLAGVFIHLHIFGTSTVDMAALRHNTNESADVVKAIDLTDSAQETIVGLTSPHKKAHEDSYGREAVFLQQMPQTIETLLQQE